MQPTDSISDNDEVELVTTVKKRKKKEKKRDEEEEREKTHHRHKRNRGKEKEGQKLEEFLKHANRFSDLLLSDREKGLTASPLALTCEEVDDPVRVYHFSQFVHERLRLFRLRFWSSACAFAAFALSFCYASYVAFLVEERAWFVCSLVALLLVLIFATCALFHLRREFSSMYFESDRPLLPCLANTTMTYRNRNIIVYALLFFVLIVLFLFLGILALPAEGASTLLLIWILGVVFSVLLHCCCMPLCNRKACSWVIKQREKDARDLPISLKSSSVITSNSDPALGVRDEYFAVRSQYMAACLSLTTKSGEKIRTRLPVATDVYKRKCGRLFDRMVVEYVRCYANDEDEVNNNDDHGDVVERLKRLEQEECHQLSRLAPMSNDAENMLKIVQLWTESLQRTESSVYRIAVLADCVEKQRDIMLELEKEFSGEKSSDSLAWDDNSRTGIIVMNPKGKMKVYILAPALVDTLCSSKLSDDDLKVMYDVSHWIFRPLGDGEFLTKWRTTNLLDSCARLFFHSRYHISSLATYKYSFADSCGSVAVVKMAAGSILNSTILPPLIVVPALSDFIEATVLHWKIICYSVKPPVLRGSDAALYVLNSISSDNAVRVAVNVLHKYHVSRRW